MHVRALVTLLLLAAGLQDSTAAKETPAADSLPVHAALESQQSFLGDSQQPLSGDSQKALWGREEENGRRNHSGIGGVATSERQELGRERREWREVGWEGQELGRERRKELNGREEREGREETEEMERREGRDEWKELELGREETEGKKGWELQRMGQKTGREGWELGREEREGRELGREGREKQEGMEEREGLEEQERRKGQEEREVGQELGREGSGLRKGRDGRDGSITLGTLNPDENLSLTIGLDSMFNAGTSLLSSLLVAAAVLGVAGISAGVIAAVAGGWKRYGKEYIEDFSSYPSSSSSSSYSAPSTSFLPVAANALPYGHHEDAYTSYRRLEEAQKKYGE